MADETIRAILGPERAAPLLQGPRWFCRTPDCRVVYYASSSMIAKDMAPVRVGLKEQEDPVPLCYCFGFNLADVRREIAATGTTAIPARITAEIRGGNCACERLNPSGVCCLGDVNAAVAREMARSSDRK